MPYTMEDFERDYVRDHLDVLTVEEILQRLPTKEVLQLLPVEEVLQRLPVEKLKAYLDKLEQESEPDKDKKDCRFQPLNESPQKNPPLVSERPSIAQCWYRRNTHELCDIRRSSDWTASSPHPILSAYRG